MSGHEVFQANVLCFLAVIDIYNSCKRRGGNGTGADLLFRRRQFQYETLPSSGYSSRGYHQGDGKSSIIFRGDRDLFWIIDHEEKTYTEITREDLRRLKQKMQQMYKITEKRLSRLSPERREKMKSMLKARMGRTHARISYKKTGSNIKVNQWICDKYMGTAMGEKKKDVWTTHWQNLNLRAGDFSVMVKMSDFFMELAGAFANMRTPIRSSIDFKVGSKKWAQESGYYGVPVKIITYSNGSKQRMFQIKKIIRQKLDPSIFNPPTGYKKQTMKM